MNDSLTRKQNNPKEILHTLHTLSYTRSADEFSSVDFRNKANLYLLSNPHKEVSDEYDCVDGENSVRD